MISAELEKFLNNKDIKASVRFARARMELLPLLPNRNKRRELLFLVGNELGGTLGERNKVGRFWKFPDQSTAEHKL